MPDEVKDKTSYSAPVSENFSVRRKKSRTLGIALAGMIAGVYTALTLALGTLSFGVLNLRLSNILIGAVPIIGLPSVFGISLGVFLGNLLGPSLGPLDYIGSPLFSLAGLFAIYYLRRKSVLLGLAVYSIILSAWVSFELSFVSRIPFFPTVYYVFGGVTFIVLVLGYMTYRTLLSSGLKRRIDELGL